MRSKRKLSLNEALVELVLVLWLGSRVLAVCPSVCSCSRSHREADCSWRGLRQLPDSLQHNLRSLNLSHNRLHSLDGEITAYTHLRILDVSHNRLTRLPANLPRSLWQLHAASNRIRLLDKNDTVYQWNLEMLDLSSNRMERAVFINNTLTNLCRLNLSHNYFWTLPTNLPVHLQTIDLSHNLLVNVLPGSLDRLPRLTHFYLHANRFSTLPFGVLDRMPSLRVITLGSNPWACHLYADIAYLLSWTQHTSASVLGCPCHTEPICGGHHPSRAGGWHFASYNLPPLAASASELSSMMPEAGVTGWQPVLSLQSTAHAPIEQHAFTDTSMSISMLTPRTTRPHIATDQLSATASTTKADNLPHTDSNLAFEMTSTADRSSGVTLATDRFFTMESTATQTRKTTTLRTRSVRRQNQSPPSGVSSCSPSLAAFSLLNLLVYLVILFGVL
ncbi:oligodendrocyte-myelin glycoprotein-like [Pholidichthys leucotaenia]